MVDCTITVLFRHHQSKYEIDAGGALYNSLVIADYFSNYFEVE